jgi:CheY-like chemotaxis protein
LTPRILVADDEPDMRRLLKMRLEHEGWAADTAASGEEAVELWRARTYDLALLDQRMGGMTGLDTAHVLRDKGFTRPIVIFSAYLDPRIEEAAAAAGIVTVAKAEVGDLCPIVGQLLEDANGSP